MAAKTSKTTPKPTPDTSAPAPAEVKADVSTTAAAPAAAEVVPPAATEAQPIVAAVEEAPLAGAVEGEAFGDFLPPTGDEENVVTHTISAVPEKGFSRAGVRWHREPTYVNRADFADDKWEALTNEPNLVVRELTQ